MASKLRRSWITLGIAIICLGASSAQAQSTLACWAQEGYLGESIHLRQIERWNLRAVSEPPYYHRARALQVYRREGAQILDRYRNDRRAHCYIGCLVAQQTDYRTASWAGWTKEYSDLTDCRPQTPFEESEYDATLIGATYGLGTESPRDCLEFCRGDI